MLGGICGKNRITAKIAKSREGPQSETASVPITQPDCGFVLINSDRWEELCTKSR